MESVVGVAVVVEPVVVEPVAAESIAALQAAPQTSTYQWPYPPAASKKGLQVELVEDALELGIEHAGLNLNLTQLVNPFPSPAEVGGPQIEMDGRVFHLHPAYLEGLDRQIKTLSDAGVLVNVIVLTYLSGGWLDRGQRSELALVVGQHGPGHDGSVQPGL